MSFSSLQIKETFDERQRRKGKYIERQRKVVSFFPLDIILNTTVTELSHGKREPL
jgi:hypothetical protein